MWFLAILAISRSVYMRYAKPSVIMVLGWILSSASSSDTQEGVVRGAAASLDDVRPAVCVIFDLGGVLLKTSQLAVANDVGIVTLARYMLRNMKNPRTALFELLDTVPSFTETPIRPLDENGEPLPGLMCDWLKGASSHAILTRLRSATDPSNTLFKIAASIFDGKRMSDAHTIIPRGLAFVDECLQKGFSVYIISNWDAESFAHMYRRNPEFFKRFSGIVLSGHCGLVKPDPEIFKYALSAFGLDPETCFFFDDQQKNVDAARTLGIEGTRVAPGWRGEPDFGRARSAFVAWYNALKKSSKKDESQALCFSTRPAIAS